jgi:Flp pilus assembly pilin Flp
VLEHGIDIRLQHRDHPQGGRGEERVADGSYMVFLEADMSGALRLLRGNAGQTMAEYAVVLGVITLAVVATLGLLNAAILNLLNGVIALI